MHIGLIIRIYTVSIQICCGTWTRLTSELRVLTYLIRMSVAWILDTLLSYFTPIIYAGDKLAAIWATWNRKLILGLD